MIGRIDPETSPGIFAITDLFAEKPPAQEPVSGCRARKGWRAWCCPESTWQRHRQERGGHRASQLNHVSSTMSVQPWQFCGDNGERAHFTRSACARPEEQSSPFFCPVSVLPDLLSSFRLNGLPTSLGLFPGSVSRPSNQDIDRPRARFWCPPYTLFLERKLPCRPEP